MTKNTTVRGGGHSPNDRSAITENKDESSVSKKIIFEEKSENLDKSLDITKSKIDEYREDAIFTGDERFMLEPVGLTEGQFPVFLKNYLETCIDDKMRNSFNDYETLLAKQSNGYERHYIKMMF